MGIVHGDRRIRKVGGKVCVNNVKRDGELLYALDGGRTQAMQLFHCSIFSKRLFTVCRDNADDHERKDSEFFFVHTHSSFPVAGI